MKRIAVSMRVDEHGAYGERRDALDQRWIPLLEAMGLTPVPLPNALAHPEQWALSLGISGLLLTGGNDICRFDGVVAKTAAPERDRSEEQLLELARARGWPALGVCRGLQMLNAYCGGGLAAVIGHVGQCHEVFPTRSSPRFFLPTGAPAPVSVNSFHGSGIPPGLLARDLVPVYCDAQGWVEAAEHQHLPWAGIMWHPERDAVLQERDRYFLNELFSNHD